MPPECKKRAKLNQKRKAKLLKPAIGTKKAFQMLAVDKHRTSIIPETITVPAITSEKTKETGEDWSDLDPLNVGDGQYKSLYIQFGNSKPLLLAMAYGLKDGEPDMADVSLLTYKQQDTAKKPKKPDYQQEIKRRGKVKKSADPFFRLPHPNG